MVKKVDKDIGKKIRKIPRSSFKTYDSKKIKSKFGSDAQSFIKRNNLIVAPLPIDLKKRGFIGYRQPGITVNGKKITGIFIDRGLSKSEEKITFWHEAGHHKAKRILTPKIRSKLEKELNKTDAYRNLKKQKYTKKQIPEEILVEIFSMQKVQKRKIKKSSAIKGKSRFPVLQSQLRKLKSRI